MSVLTLNFAKKQQHFSLNIKSATQRKHLFHQTLHKHQFTSRSENCTGQYYQTMNNERELLRRQGHRRHGQGLELRLIQAEAERISGLVPYRK